MAEEKRYGLHAEEADDLEEIRKRIAERKQEKIKRRKRAKNMVIAIFSAVVIVIGLVIFSFSDFFVVDYIEVQGNSFYTAEEIISMAHAAPGKNLIYHPDKAKTIGYLEENPYIKHANVSRKFPSTLLITVEERKQLAALRFDDKFLVIDEEGILLRKTKTEPQLTLVEGIVVKKIDVGEAVAVEDEELFEQTLDILRKMKSHDLYFVKLDMTGMYIKAYIYESLVCKGTCEQLLEGIEKNRLHKVLEKLFEEGIRRGTITFSDEGYTSYEPKI